MQVNIIKTFHKLLPPALLGLTRYVLHVVFVLLCDSMLACLTVHLAKIGNSAVVVVSRCYKYRDTNIRKNSRVMWQIGPIQKQLSTSFFPMYVFKTSVNYINADDLQGDSSVTCMAYVWLET